MSHRDIGADGNGSSAKLIPIASLRPGDSPRLGGENRVHAQALAQSEAVLPPIVVQRSTMRVVDGMHRLRAAELRGQTEILVQFFEGDDESAFVVAVEANIAHGLPLSLADRTAAAARIVVARPDWSNRKVASVTGLAATTVGAIRQRSSDESGSNTEIRVGLDGRARPVNSADRRLLASKLIKDRPTASLREIAQAAGISPATVLDVRNRLREGRHPVPERQHRMSKSMPRLDQDMSGSSRVGQITRSDREMLLLLKKDPSLRFTDAGRGLLRWLDIHTVGLDQWRRHVGNVPQHCVQKIVELARRNGNVWQHLAQYLETRG